MKIKACMVIFFVGLLAVVSCKKVDSGGNANPAPNTFVTDTNIYVAGYVNNYSNYLQIPAYWKNGALYKFADSSLNSSAESIAVHDTNVLISATIEHTNGGAYTAIYYLNGNKVVLADSAFVGMSQSAAFGSCGCDIYVCGAMKINGHYKAIYWKNGTAHLLPNNSPDSFALGILENNGNIYVAGSAVTTVNSKYAVYWKNDVSYPLADTLSDSEARGIALVGADIYVAGYSRSGSINVAAYWKNGVQTNFDRGGLLSVTTDGTNVFLGGDQGISGQGAYWKNGTLNLLSAQNFQPSVDGIAVFGSDVYVAGWIVSNQGQVSPAYWKNGVYTPLTYSFSGVAQSIRVVTYKH